MKLSQLTQYARDVEAAKAKLVTSLVRSVVGQCWGQLIVLARLPRDPLPARCYCSGKALDASLVRRGRPSRMLGLPRLSIMSHTIDALKSCKCQFTKLMTIATCVRVWPCICVYVRESVKCSSNAKWHFICKTSSNGSQQQAFATAILLPTLVRSDNSQSFIDACGIAAKNDMQ